MNTDTSTEWVQSHLDSIVTIGNDAWSIERIAKSSTGPFVVLRSSDGERLRVESPRRVASAFRSENS